MPPQSIFDASVLKTIDDARSGAVTLYPSPADWRDEWIYFIMVDRFDNPAARPKNPPYDAQFGEFQGGTFNGIRRRLQYIKDLGAGAIWLSPPLKNCAYESGSYHGYGIQNFLGIEPRYASAPGLEETELRALVDEAHALGLYVIFDIVLHHAGDVFVYDVQGGQQDSLNYWNDANPLSILWRGGDGKPIPNASQPPAASALDGAIWPKEIQFNEAFTRQGDSSSGGFHPAGDFDSLKGFAADDASNGPQSFHDALIDAYQYIIAKFDVDAFRIDTLKYIPADFERVFGNAMREFALSIGKKNFFTFGEVYDQESEIAQFIGRNTTTPDAPVGVDAALDYPLFFKLPNMLKGFGITPSDIANVFETRKNIEEGVLTSHGEAGKYFVTFLDNHDQPQRYGYTGAIQLTNQIIIGIGCLFCIQGIPCIYYGTEQGLSGHKTLEFMDDSMVREALWGKPANAGAVDAFDNHYTLYTALQAISTVRQQQPAIRYGRQYFRPISGNSRDFGASTFPGGILAFSRLLDDEEVVIVVNVSTTSGFAGQVIVDYNLNPIGAAYKILYSNKAAAGAPGPVTELAQGTVTIHEIDGSITNGPIRILQVQLGPSEIQILKV